ARRAANPRKGKSAKAKKNEPEKTEPLGVGGP
ncbi:MAG: hypothetical protein RL477_230, partial [Pseudomonadota bacterium]